MLSIEPPVFKVIKKILHLNSEMARPHQFA